MLSEQEVQQICRVYKVTCPVCATDADHQRLKRDMVRATKTAGDGYPLEYKWAKPGFDSVDPKQFIIGVCAKCGFAGELDDADYRQAGSAPEAFRRDFEEKALQVFKDGAAAGKGAAQSLLKRLTESDPLLRAISQVHLGILSQCARTRILPGPIARYYLRIAWLFRDRERYYAASDLEAVAASLDKCRSRWKKDLPPRKDYPIEPDIAVDEVQALRMSRSFFERNYETLKEAGPEDELRLRYLLAEIGFRLYELTDESDDHKKAASFFSGTMQQCLSIISDKSIVGGIVNRAREMLEVAGERGRELRALHKRRGGSDDAGTAEAVPAKAERKKPVANAAPSAAAPRTEPVAKGKEEKVPVVSGKDAVRAAAGNGKTEAAGTTTAGDLGQTDRDRMTRQITVLTEEVTLLKGRVQELEDDNRKWRQLIGRDALTGLPNKITLFRIQLPKVIRNFAESGPYSCIAIGLDQVGKVNLEHGWLMGDRMLKASARGLRKFLQDGDELYRIDGANFVIAGPMDGNAARQRATELRRALGGSTVRVDETTMPLSSSLGVVTVEQKVGDSDADIADAVYTALLLTLYRAKEKGGNTAEIHNITRF